MRIGKIWERKKYKSIKTELEKDCEEVEEMKKTLELEKTLNPGLKIEKERRLGKKGLQQQDKKLEDDTKQLEEGGKSAAWENRNHRDQIRMEEKLQEMQTEKNWL